MRNKSVIKRFTTYCKKRGFLRTFLRLFIEPYRIIFKNKVVLLYADLSEVNDSIPPLPPGIIIECIENYHEAIQPNMQKIISYWEKENMLNEIEEKFDLGAKLWIVKSDEDIAAFTWSIMGKTHRPWYLPITPNDVYCFGAFTFKEYRGRGFHPLITNYRFNKLKIQGGHRAFGEIHTWNNSSLPVIGKTSWKKFSEAQRFRFFGRNITIWKQ